MKNFLLLILSLLLIGSLFMACNKQPYNESGTDTDTDIYTDKDNNNAEESGNVYYVDGLKVSSPTTNKETKKDL